MGRRGARYRRILFNMSSGKKLYWPVGDTPWIEVGRGKREAIVDVEVIREMESRGLIENVVSPELSGTVKCFVATGLEVSDG